MRPTPRSFPRVTGREAVTATQQMRTMAEVAEEGWRETERRLRARRVWDREGIGFVLVDRFGRTIDVNGWPITLRGGVWERVPLDEVIDPRECPGCGAEFLPTRSDQRTCGARCRKRRSRARSA
jgi:hypothetical protein